jgi:conjugative relaxase-like TrwC/TraI family protein
VTERPRGAPAGIEQLPVGGVVAAAFRHRTSRAGDAHLHTHVVVANSVLGTDGKWSTLDARHLYHHAKTVGSLYEAELRHHLSTRLGVRWGDVRNGIADIDGMSNALLATFSTRRAEIDEALAIRGQHSVRAAQIATL